MALPVIAGERQKGIDAVAQLRESGNTHFKAQDFGAAAGTYRKALEKLRRLETDPSGDVHTCTVGGESFQQLGQVVRLNLAMSLLRLSENLSEAAGLCDEVIAVDPSSAKALFRRGAVRQCLARQFPEPASQKEMLKSAREDLVQAAKAEPTDRQVRQLLEEVTQELRKLYNVPPGGTGLCGGLYDDRQAAPAAPPAPVVVCETCGREGHAGCGRSLWVQERCQWLGLAGTPAANEVGNDPAEFDDDGTLYAAVRAVRESRGQAPSLDSIGDGGISDMSEDERERLEHCLDSTERPYPRLKRRLNLAKAVRCAEEFWAEAD